MELKEVSVDKIKPNPLQPREHFDREKIQELADSVKEVGLIQPISVRPSDNGMYEIIAGERRWKALQIAGVKKIPAIVKKLQNGALMVESLIENLHREDLSYVEKAKALKIIMDREKIDSGRVLAKRVGMSHTSIQDIFDSAGMREKLEGPSREVSQNVIAETRGLETEERKKIIERAAEEDLGGRKVREMVSVVKKAPEPIRRAVLEEDLEPKVAEEIMRVDEPSVQKEALYEATRGKLTADGVRDKIDAIKLRQRKLDIERPEEAYHQFTNYLTELGDTIERLQKTDLSILSKNQIDGMARSLYIFMAQSLPKFIKFLIDNGAEVDPRFREYANKFVGSS